MTCQELSNNYYQGCPTGEDLAANLEFSERECLSEIRLTLPYKHVEGLLERADDHLQGATGLGVEGRRMYMAQGDYELQVGNLLLRMEEKRDEIASMWNEVERLQAANFTLVEKFASVEQIIEERVQAELKRRDDLRAPTPQPGRRQLLLEEVSPQ